MSQNIDAFLDLVKVRNGKSVDRFDQHASFAPTGGFSFMGMQYQN